MLTAKDVWFLYPLETFRFALKWDIFAQGAIYRICGLSYTAPKLVRSQRTAMMLRNSYIVLPLKPLCKLHAYCHLDAFMNVWISL